MWDGTDTTYKSGDDWGVLLGPGWCRVHPSFFVKSTVAQWPLLSHVLYLQYTQHLKTYFYIYLDTSLLDISTIPPT